MIPRWPSGHFVLCQNDADSVAAVSFMFASLSPLGSPTSPKRLASARDVIPSRESSAFHRCATPRGGKARFPLKLFHQDLVVASLTSADGGSQSEMFPKRTFGGSRASHSRALGVRIGREKARGNKGELGQDEPARR